MRGNLKKKNRNIPNAIKEMEWNGQIIISTTQFNECHSVIEIKVQSKSNGHKRLDHRDEEYKNKMNNNTIA